MFIFPSDAFDQNLHLALWLLKFILQKHRYFKISRPCGSTCRFEPFFHYWKQFPFLGPCLFRTFLGLSGCNITFNSILEPNVKNLCDDVIFPYSNFFGLKFAKSQLVGLTCRFEPFFQYWKQFIFLGPCLPRTFLGLSGCNITFKWIFGASVKNICDDVIFFHIQNFSEKSAKSQLVGLHVALSPFFNIENNSYF